MSRVDELAIGYIEMWEETYMVTNDKGIVLAAITRAMSDIELWCNGGDRNGSNASALTPEEARALYAHLSGAAAHFGFSPNPRTLE